MDVGHLEGEEYIVEDISTQNVSAEDPDEPKPGILPKLFDFIKFVGPGVLISVGYIDPGNWATDIEGGSVYEYKLIWVLFFSNTIAILLQTLSGIFFIILNIQKQGLLGLVTGKDLAQQCRNFYPSYFTWILWALAEFAIAATDMAEVLGTAIGLKILFGLPLVWGAIITVLDTLALLVIQNFGHRFIEILVVFLMTAISGCFLFEMIVTKPSFVGIMKGLVIPQLPPGSLTIATGILGATIMPHNIYLHSGIVVNRSSQNKNRTFWNCLYAFFDGILSLNLAFLINASILITAAAFHNREDKPKSIESAYVLLESVFGRAASVVFGVALLLSGQSSTITGTMAGSIVMEGFIQISITPWIRRLITRCIAIIPATIILIIVGDSGATQLLIWSQIVLSIQLPFAMVPLIRITSHKYMGEFQNYIFVRILGWICVFIVGGLNVWLIVDIAMQSADNLNILVWIGVGILSLIWFGLLAFCIFCPISPKDGVNQQQDQLEDLINEEVNDDYNKFHDETTVELETKDEEEIEDI
eukprot:gene4294-7650_t